MNSGILRNYLILGLCVLLEIRTSHRLFCFHVFQPMKRSKFPRRLRLPHFFLRNQSLEFLSTSLSWLFKYRFFFGARYGIEQQTDKDFERLREDANRTKIFENDANKNNVDETNCSPLTLREARQLVKYMNSFQCSTERSKRISE